MIKLHVFTTIEKQKHEEGQGCKKHWIDNRIFTNCNEIKIENETDTTK